MSAPTCTPPIRLLYPSNLLHHLRPSGLMCLQEYTIQQYEDVLPYEQVGRLRVSIGWRQGCVGGGRLVHGCVSACVMERTCTSDRCLQTGP